MAANYVSTAKVVTLSPNIWHKKHCYSGTTLARKR